MATRKYRIIILGAGFSVQAHLPLADELWMKILAKRKTLRGRAAKFNDDLDSYIKYCKECDGKKLTYESVNFEEFLGFLDIEHYLELRGGDTWSDNGNEGQIVIKTFIGEILSGYMPGPNDIPELYLEFARRLQPNDYVLTFNYDVLLERALDAVGKPYRLFPERYNRAIYSLVKNYQVVNWGKEMYGQKKSPLVLVDCKTTEKDIEDYKKNYRFVDFRKAELHMKGFDLEAIEKIFS